MRLRTENVWNMTGEREREKREREKRERGAKGEEGAFELCVNT